MVSASAHTDQQILTADSAFRGQGFTKRVEPVPLTREYFTDHDRKHLDRETSNPVVSNRELSLVQVHRDVHA